MPIDFYFVGPSPPCRAVQMAAKHLNVELNKKVVNMQKGREILVLIFLMRIYFNRKLFQVSIVRNGLSR